MPKIHSFFPLFLSAFLILCLSLGLVFYYNVQSDRTKALAFESMKTLAEWNKLQNGTKQILLGRVTVGENKSPDMVSAWRNEYKEFSKNLNALAENRQVEKLPLMKDQLNGAMRVWRFTEVHLNNAEHYFKKMQQTGLTEKVMVNGFIHTMYKLRINRLLNSSEIFLLDDTIYALETLFKSSYEFNTLLEKAVEDLNNKGIIYLKRIRLHITGLLASVFILFIATVLINRQLKTAQKNRSAFLDEKTDKLLRAICLDSSEGNLKDFDNFRMEHKPGFTTSKPLQMICIEIDGYEDIRKNRTDEESDRSCRDLNRDLSQFIEKAAGYEALYFKWFNGTYIFLVNVKDQDCYDGLIEKYKKELPGFRKEHDINFSFIPGVITTEDINLDEDFSILMKLAEYRYITGKSSFIHMGSSHLHPGGVFHYPQEKEKHLTDALNVPDAEKANLLIDEILHFSEPYGPQAAKRTVYRLSAAISNVMEKMENIRHINFLDEFTPLILEVQRCEYLSEVKILMKDMIKKMSEACMHKKEERHDSTVSDIKKIIYEKLEDFNLSSEIIAEEFNLSASYINRMFKSHTSLSIASYINTKRLAKAEQMLRNSDYTINEIAETSGFASTGTFFRLFKKNYGRTPKDFQRETRNS